jgi:hypothetical protein
MRRRTPKDRYDFNVRKQTQQLENFAEHEIEWAGLLIRWYESKKREMPADIYRACAFFLNKEYLKKPGSLTLTHQMYKRCLSELPEVTKENAFDILRFRFRMYAKALQKGEY